MGGWLRKISAFYRAVWLPRIKVRLAFRPVLQATKKSGKSSKSFSVAWISSLMHLSFLLFVYSLLLLRLYFEDGSTFPLHVEFVRCNRQVVHRRSL
jgi:hypothetical protein